MKQLYLFRGLYLSIVIFLFAGLPVLAQFRNSQITWVGTPINSNKTIDGFYESLPEGYTNSTAQYPLLVYLHGDESVEDGYTEILKNSIPKLIAEGSFPETFKEKGKDHSFIVIAPHFTIKNLSADEFGEAINYIIRKYRVNPNRIYLTGMSRGSAYT